MGNFKRFTLVLLVFLSSGALSGRTLAQRPDQNGDFRIGLPYVPNPAFTEKPGVPKGRVVRFTMNSAESKTFPTAPAGTGTRGERGGAPAQAPQHQSFERQVAVYIPAGYVPNTPAPFVVIQDERWYIKEDAPPAADGSVRTDLPFIAPMLDNLIYEKRIPAIVAVLLSPGPGNQRSIEYDTVSDRYTNFVETEVLPRITKDYNVAFTTDPEGRAAMGESSGAACALTMAWLHPNLYRRVISYSGTFVALQRNATAPNGAWDFHQTFIPNSERHPLRIWLHISENDLGKDTPAEGMRNWIIANQRMANVLKTKGYPYQFVFSEGSGHVDRRVELQTMPEAFEWVWKDYKPLTARVQQRSYLFTDTNEQLPYAVFVSSKVSKDRKNPLIIALHGLGGNQNTLMRPGALERAEEGGYILVGPMGYNSGGWYGAPARFTGTGLRGAPNGATPPPPAGGTAVTDPAKIHELSEKDVLNVLDMIRKEFNVDERRTYLMGHSMGGAGAIYLGTKYASTWAAVAAIASATAPAGLNPDSFSLQPVRNVPMIIVQGDADPLVPVAGTRHWIDKMKELNLTHQYIEVPGGDHGSVINTGIPDIFAFFAKYKRQ
jgi:enterochelin esterase-like enzyme